MIDERLHQPRQSQAFSGQTDLTFEDSCSPSRHQELESKLATIEERAGKVITFNVVVALSMVAAMALAVTLPFA
ncbi:MAG: hypothetical protein ACPGOV_07375 [Magnetovibrionaceae bacterium]